MDVGWLWLALGPHARLLLSQSRLGTALNGRSSMETLGYQAETISRPARNICAIEPLYRQLRQIERTDFTAHERAAV
jgi:hypothetical protein